MNIVLSKSFEVFQSPPPGERLLLKAGDVLTVELRLNAAQSGVACLRTNLGRGLVARKERVAYVERSRPVLAADWHDLPMEPLSDNRFAIRLPLLEVGEFAAKACFVPTGTRRPVWPQGGNLTLKVGPAWTVCANTVYTAFVRLFRPPGRRSRASLRQEAALDRRGYTVIPPSGTFRALRSQLDHIVGRMGFRVLQLLPIHPSPTTYARMGRYGSPFAGLDLMAVDPALAEFDRKTTPLDQFRELIDAVHARSAKIFMDLPANHTGWASTLQNHHPEWFRRNPDGTFRSPGAWGVVWEDLAELDFDRPGVGFAMAEVFRFWCAQGVDGFRCDAGYMIPEEVWSYIVAKTRLHYPDTIFLLEGLGGKISVTERLLRTSNLDWAYSEVFQTEDRAAFEAYLPDALALSQHTGPLIHYAETHDNSRLAAKGKAYARLRTVLAALLSHQGAFGITNGVEWFADEKIDVHEATSLRWNARCNQVSLVRRLNALLAAHPAFGPAGVPHLVTAGDGNTLAAIRVSKDKKLLVVANLDTDRCHHVKWPREAYDVVASRDLLTCETLSACPVDSLLSLALEPAEVRCLQPASEKPFSVRRNGKQGEPTAVSAQCRRLSALRLRSWLSRKTTLDAGEDPHRLSDELCRDPEAFVRRYVPADQPVPIMTWSWPEDSRRTLVLPPGYVLSVRADCAFHVRVVRFDRPGPFSPCLPVDETDVWRAPVVGETWGLRQPNGQWFAFLPPLPVPVGDHQAYRLLLIRYVDGRAERQVAPLLALAPGETVKQRLRYAGAEVRENAYFALLTNGRGAMARVRARWGEVQGQYDALLAANLHPSVPVDRTVVWTRCRGWVVNKGYSQAINADMLACFEVDPAGVRADWHFQAPVGGGSWVPLTLSLRMSRGRNRVTLAVTRAWRSQPAGTLNDTNLDAGPAAQSVSHSPGFLQPETPKTLFSASPAENTIESDETPVDIILRPDIEWRGFHEKTKAFTGPEWRWPDAVESQSDGFSFHPERESIRLFCDVGSYHAEPEWQYAVKHPEDAERGLDNTSDLFSPGFFQIELFGGQRAHLTAEIASQPIVPKEAATVRPLPSAQSLENGMRQSLETFIVKRGGRHTVIAGYPWFLDWGRDTLIVLRGMIAAGKADLALSILCEFGQFEDQGTLPNMIRGEDSANRDTSDAPLWFLQAAADAIGCLGARAVLEADCDGRSLSAVAASILEHYCRGTPNGIRVDAASGLVYSPPHFTWMDTNHPAGTPRGGYPVEIQALWLQGLRFGIRYLERVRWAPVYRQASRSFNRLFAEEPFDHLCDCRMAGPGNGAAEAEPDDALRCNGVLALALGAISNRKRMRQALTACESLLVPGAIRTLADRPVHRPLEIRIGRQLLGNPLAPYRGRYLGDEDHERKPAYHNGTAWTWVLPAYAEALWRLYGRQAQQPSLALLGGISEWVNRDCVGHVPEILDGDSPHIPRGCGAQAWSVSEWLRVWLLISRC